MKLTAVILLAACLQVSANGFSQNITLHVQNMPLEKVFREIKKQSGYSFAYTKDMVPKAKKVTVQVTNAGIEETLRKCFANQPFTYTIINKVVIVNTRDAPIVMEEEPPATTGLPSLIDVQGRVVNENNEPMIVSVSVKGTTKGTTTNTNGEFILTAVDEQATLIISGVSIEQKEIKVNNRATINITVKMAAKELDETVVVAYGTATQRSNTGAVTIVKGAQIANLPNRSLDKSLQGLVPGLQITNGTGQPGGGVSNMVLRGIATGTDAVLGSTVRNPLIVIDGIPVSQDNFQIRLSTSPTPVSNPMAQLNPSDIESISILKDAAAIALYGSKASNGVILVTTKKGKPGKTVFGFRHQTDLSTAPSRKKRTLNRAEYLELLYETYRNSDPVSWTDQAIRNDLYKKFPYQVTGTDTSFYPDQDWTTELFNKYASTISNELSISGGNEKSNFYLNVEYLKQNGVVKKTGYDRKSFRFNFETQPASWLKLSTNTALSYNVQDYANPNEDAVSFALGPIMSPLNPIRTTDGNYLLNYDWGSVSSAESQNNPVAAAEYNINRNTAYRGITSIRGTISFLRDFSFSSNLGVDFMLAEMKEKTDPRFKTSRATEFGSITERNIRRTTAIATNILTYNRAITREHVLSVLLGQEAQVLNEKKLGGDVVGTNSTLPYYNEISSPGYTMRSLSGTSSKQTLSSLFGQANYHFRNKYFFSASIRRDGSSRFGARRQWGTYWSVGSGWVLTEERAVKKLVPWLNYFKLRGSIGAAGSSGAIGASTRYELLNLLLYQNRTAVTPPHSPGNPDIQWEKTFTWDLGIEARIFQERIRLTADLYKRKTSDLVYSIFLAPVTGYMNVMDNIGDMQNKGLELSISADILKTKQYRWNLTANWSSNQNVLVKANVPLSAVTGVLLGNEEGRNFNSFYLRQWAGVNPDDGKPLWIDSTGKASGNYNAAKRAFVGKPQPDGYGAVTNTFSYGGIDLGIQLYYQYGFRIYDQNAAFTLLTDGTSPYINQTTDALQRWQKTGDIAINPRRMLNNTDGGTRTSTRYLFDGDYVRLQYVQLSYNFPQKILDKLQMKMLRVFVQGNNLAVWTKFPGGDPDNTNPGGGNGAAYPNARTYSVGLTTNF